MKNSILKNGIISGILVSVFMVCMTIYMKYNPTSEPSMIVGFASMLMAFFLYLLELNNKNRPTMVAFHL